MKAKHPDEGHRTPSEIKIDPEFAGWIPIPSKQERDLLEKKLTDKICLEPVVVWKGHDLVWDGFLLYDLCAALGVSFPVRYVELPDRRAALAYLIEIQRARRNLSRLGNSYFRGKRYVSERQPNGGNRTRPEALHHFDKLTKPETTQDNEKAVYQNDKQSTAQRLATEHNVGEATIVRDGQLYEAVESIVARCGADAKNLLLSPDSKLTRERIVEESGSKLEDLQEFLRVL